MKSSSGIALLYDQIGIFKTFIEELHYPYTRFSQHYADKEGYRNINQQVEPVSYTHLLEIIDGGIINKGKISQQLGVKGMSRLSEDTITARELAIAQDTQMPIHITHVSTKGSVNTIRGNTHIGVMCTCETAPHYFMMTDEKLLSRDADYRMNPPLREEDDVMAITAAVANGTRCV